MACKVYRSIYLPDLGYVVYRHIFDEAKCAVEAGARVHKQAVFVEEVAAVDYCRYRNRKVDCTGSDAIIVPL